MLTFSQRCAPECVEHLWWYGWSGGPRSAAKTRCGPVVPVYSYGTNGDSAPRAWRTTRLRARGPHATVYAFVVTPRGVSSYVGRPRPTFGERGRGPQTLFLAFGSPRSPYAETFRARATTTRTELNQAECWNHTMMDEAIPCPRQEAEDADGLGRGATSRACPVGSSSSMARCVVRTRGHSRGRLCYIYRRRACVASRVCWSSSGVSATIWPSESRTLHLPLWTGLDS